MSAKLPFSFSCNHFRRKPTVAFSLVEVVLAMSVMSFASIILLGLLPTGLRTVHNAVSATVQAQIMQSIVDSSEIESYPSTGIFTNSAGASPAVYYYDDEGTLLPNTPASYVYKATVTSVQSYLPGASANSPGPGLQWSSSGGQPGVGSLLRVVIVSVNDPNEATTNTVVWPNTGT